MQQKRYKTSGGTAGKIMNTKRLFLFAGYDAQGIIDDSLLHYLQCLSGYGDVIFFMDNKVSDPELDKLKEIPNILHAKAERHGEYDFGSYKRGYQWADKNNLLNKYDWVYLVNDSVYGPLFDIEGILVDLETRGVDLTGMIDFANQATPVQVQSWFVGLSRRVANSAFLHEFMNEITRQVDKQLIVLKYEVGLSQRVLQHGYRMSTYISGEVGDKMHRVYDKPLEMLKSGLPFLKKNSLPNLPGIQYLYPYASAVLVDKIYQNAMRVGLKLAISEKPRYEKSYRLTFLSIPLLTIYRQRHDIITTTCYKVYLFDFIPLIKIFTHK